MQRFDVLSICNALVDVLIEVSDEELTELGLNKGIMHLVDTGRQRDLLTRFASRPMHVELGGSAMNATRCLAALGSRTFFVGMVGKDDFGLKIRSRMAELGIYSGVKETDESTGSCVVLITPDHERTMVTSLGASALYNETIVPHDQIAKAKVLHFTGYQWSTSQQRTAIYKAAETAESHQTLISFDVADPFMVTSCKEEFRAFVKDHADIVFSNEAEAIGLYGSVDEAAKAINDAGAIAVLKLGAKGAKVVQKSKVETISAVPTQVLDTTGAGDMFAGGFLYGFTNGKSMKECGQIAALMASDVISHIGARISQESVEKARIL